LFLNLSPSYIINIAEKRLLVLQTDITNEDKAIRKKHTVHFSMGSVLLIFLLFCVNYVLFVFVLCLVYPTLPVSLHCPFLIAASGFSNVGILRLIQILFYIFLCYIAEHLPAVGDITKNQSLAFDSDQIKTTQFVPHMGFICASLPMFFWKNQSLSNILAVLGPINFIAGLATCVILPYTDFGLIVFYGIIFAVAKRKYDVITGIICLV
jgi:hypothetical protein